MPRSSRSKRESRGSDAGSVEGSQIGPGDDEPQGQSLPLKKSLLTRPRAWGDGRSLDLLRSESSLQDELKRPTKQSRRLAKRLLLSMAKLSGDRIKKTANTGTDTDRKYKFKWLLGADGSKRRFIFFVLKYIALLYATLAFFMKSAGLAYLVLSAQRLGWLLHGKSFYLPHHTPESMRKTGMNYRNIFFTIAQKKGYSHRDIERMIL